MNFYAERCTQTGIENAYAQIDDATENVIRLGIRAIAIRQVLVLHLDD